MRANAGFAQILVSVSFQYWSPSVGQCEHLADLDMCRKRFAVLLVDPEGRVSAA
jgi:hypothetical protein